MKRFLILLGVPSLAGPGLLFTLAAGKGGASPSDLILALLFVWVIGLLISAPYAAMMELAFMFGMRPISWGALALSSGLGACTGIFVGGLLFAVREMAIYGAFVGVFTAALVCWAELARPAPSAN